MPDGEHKRTNTYTMKKTLLIAALAAGVFVAGCGPSNTERGASGQSSSSETGAGQSSSDASTPTTSDKQPDNTGVNKRDRSDQALTSGDQGNSKSDREITRNIRRAITKNDQLSTTAKNIKIITADGKTTLRGPVKSEQEKEQIASAVKSVQGVGEVDNQLEVKNQSEKNEQ
jgi:hyperosmotically inducible protein